MSIPVKVEALLVAYGIEAFYLFKILGRDDKQHGTIVIRRFFGIDDMVWKDNGDVVSAKLHFLHVVFNFYSAA